MSDRNFNLQPFSNFPLDLTITGNIIRHPNQLDISYLISGNLSAIAQRLALGETAIPSHNPMPQRKHQLWENTCLELFLGLKNTTRYWEFNLSPNGDWNIYRFTDYRQGMTEETAFASLPFDFKTNSHTLELNLTLNLEPIIPTTSNLAIGVTAVIKTQDNNLSYWALTHPGTKPDFHRRDSWIL
ncbi:MAG: hypothetical protein Tsb0014_42300 [Pleurocapsa sp.]